MSDDDNHQLITSFKPLGDTPLVEVKKVGDEDSWESFPALSGYRPFPVVLNALAWSLAWVPFWLFFVESERLDQSDPDVAKILATPSALIGCLVVGFGLEKALKLFWHCDYSKLSWKHIPAILSLWFVSLVSADPTAFLGGVDVGPAYRGVMEGILTPIYFVSIYEAIHFFHWYLFGGKNHLAFRGSLMALAVRGLNESPWKSPSEMRSLYQILFPQDQGKAVEGSVSKSRLLLGATGELFGYLLAVAGNMGFGKLAWASASDLLGDREGTEIEVLKSLSAGIAVLGHSALSAMFLGPFCRGLTLWFLNLWSENKGFQYQARALGRYIKNHYPELFAQAIFSGFGPIFRAMITQKAWEEDSEVLSHLFAIFAYVAVGFTATQLLKGVKVKWQFFKSPSQENFNRSTFLFLRYPQDLEEGRGSLVSSLTTQ